MEDIKRYSRQDLNDMKIKLQDRNYVLYPDHKAVVETLESDNLKLENETIYLSNKIEELSNIIIELINQDEDGNIGFDIEEIYNDALKYGSKGD